MLSDAFFINDVLYISFAYNLCF